MLAKLREALALIDEAKFGLAQDDLGPERAVFSRVAAQH
jgi:hypothetical protein